jgi:hypothetical protein
MGGRSVLRSARVKRAGARLKFSRVCIRTQIQTRGPRGLSSFLTPGNPPNPPTTNALKRRTRQAPAGGVGFENGSLRSAALAAELQDVGPNAPEAALYGRACSLDAERFQAGERPSAPPLARMNSDRHRSAELATGNAELISEAGEQMFADPLSAWSRKLQVLLLLFSAITLLLAWRIIEVSELNAASAKVKVLQPKYFPCVAASVTLYVLLVYVVSCYHDYALNDAKLGRFIAKAAFRLGGVKLSLIETTMTATRLWKQAIAAEAETLQRERSALAEYRKLQEESLSGTMPSYKDERFEELKRTLGGAADSDSGNAELDAVRREAALLEAVSSDLEALFSRYRSHKRIRLWLEVAAPSVLAAAASVAGFLLCASR